MVTLDPTDLARLAALRDELDGAGEQHCSPAEPGGCGLCGRPLDHPRPGCAGPHVGRAGRLRKIGGIR